MTTEDFEQFRQEILELTGLLNTEWIDLRDLLVDKKINLDNAYLVAYVEDENDGAEHGVILTSNKKLLRFISTGDDLSIQPIDDYKAITKEFPSVAVAMELFT